MSTLAQKVWFITGSSSGFGRAMLERVLKNGDIAVATLRNPTVLASLAEKYPASQLLVVKLDVSKPDEVTAAFDAARVAFGRIDVVYNNAGYAILAEVEGSPDAAARSMFEVNFWGAANVSRAAVAFFRDVNTPQGGRLLQISSAVGIQGCASVGYYSAAKFALEGLSESLAAEIDPDWNIKITLIEPGAFQTDGLSRSIERTELHPAYAKPALASGYVRQWLEAASDQPGDIAKAALLAYRLVEIPDPPMHFPLGKDAVGMVKKKGESLMGEVERFASWSDDVNRDGF